MSLSEATRDELRPIKFLTENPYRSDGTPWTKPSTKARRTERRRKNQQAKKSRKGNR